MNIFNFHDSSSMLCEIELSSLFIYLPPGEPGVPAAVVRPQGEPPLLQRQPGRQGAAGGGCWCWGAGAGILVLVLVSLVMMVLVQLVMMLGCW